MSVSGKIARDRNTSSLPAVLKFRWCPSPGVESQSGRTRICIDRFPPVEIDRIDEPHQIGDHDAGHREGQSPRMKDCDEQRGGNAGARKSYLTFRDSPRTGYCGTGRVRAERQGGKSYTDNPGVSLRTCANRSSAIRPSRNRAHRRLPVLASRRPGGPPGKSQQWKERHDTRGLVGIFQLSRSR